AVEDVRGHTEHGEAHGRQRDERDDESEAKGHAGDAASGGRNKTRSRMANCTSHSEPKAATFAASTATVVEAASSPVDAAQRAASATATVESTSPAKVSVQNGPISLTTDRRPFLPHTHRRLSSNDGPMPALVATTLAHPAASAPVATSTPSTV